MKSMPKVVLDKSLSYMFLLMVLDVVMKVVTNKSLSYVLVLMVLEQMKDFILLIHF